MSRGDSCCGPRSIGGNWHLRWVGSSKEAHLERARIFLADDHAEFLALAAGLVEAEFNVLKTFGSGQAVVDEYSALSPDLVVLDISMPGLNGIETAQKLRAAEC